MDWNKYINRLNVEGASNRERNTNRLKNQITSKSSDNPSYKSVKINGVDSNLVIDSGTKPYCKQFKSLHGQEINIGDYVEWVNSHWLVTECDSDDEIYRDGTLEECNYLLKWQNEVGVIVERWAIISSASKYNDGTDGGRVLVVGSDQLSVVVPVDEESIKLKKSMGKKFFIDNNMTDPTVYELTGTGNVADSYGGHGVTSWIVKEIAYTASQDDLTHGVCNYFSPATSINPSDETAVLYRMVIESYKDTIRANGKISTITAQLYDENNNKITDGISYVWTVSSNISEYITYSSSENVLSVSVSKDCEEYGEEISISCTSEHTGQSANIALTVQGVL